MKKKHVLVLALTFLMGSRSVIAQNNWSTNGNKLTATGKLGTTGAYQTIRNRQPRFSQTEHAQPFQRGYYGCVLCT